MKYTVGKDGILTQVEDDEPASTTTQRPATATTTTRRPATTTTSTTTRRPTTTTSTTSRPARRGLVDRLEQANPGQVLMYVSRFIMAAAVLLGIMLLFSNYDDGIGIVDYFARILHNLQNALNKVDPFYGLGELVDLSNAYETPLDVLERLILGREIIWLTLYGIRWLAATSVQLLLEAVNGVGVLLSLVFGFLFY